MTNTYSNKSQILGRIGEIIISYINNYILSENKFDMEKDMSHRRIDLKTEVKTQTPYPQGEYIYTVPASQEQKCMNADSLQFVIYDNTDTVKILECVDRTKYRHYTTSKGSKMIGFHKDAVKLLHEINSKDLAKFMRYYSQSSCVKDHSFPGYTYEDIGDQGVIELISKAKITGGNLQLSLF
jgi:hypothetical protein